MSDFDQGEIEQFRRQVDALCKERDQLSDALESRVVIEQAKGVLAERFRLGVNDAFLLLRRSARGARVRIHELAAEVVSSRKTPPAIMLGMARDSRLRAAAMIERNEMIKETNTSIKTTNAEPLAARRARAERLAALLGEPRKARVRATTRDAAVDLASRLNGHRWYLIVPDEEQWEVVIDLDGPDGNLLPDLRGLIRDWLRDTSIPATQITIGQNQIDVSAS